MQTVTSNTTQQINSALFALDRDIKNIEGNMDLQTQILNEAQTRSNADTALANSINNVSSELSQAQLTAYAYGVSGSAATAVTQVITISGSTSYNAVAGSRVLVSFPNGYTPSNEDSELLLQIGNMAALPALAQGVAMKYGSVPAGAMIEFTYTGSAWCCQSNIIKATSDYTLYADGETRYKNYVRNQSTIGGTLYAEKSMYFYLRNLLGNPQYGAYRFKFYLMGSAYNTYYCEGHIAIYEYAITIYIDSKSSEISSVTWDSSNEQMQVVVTDAIYAGLLSVTSQETWVPCP